MGIVTVIKGAVTALDSTPTANIGDRYVDSTGKEYVYALGVDSCVTGSVVAFTLETTNNTPTTALLTKTIADYGVHLGVALGACTSSYYGWFQVYGAAEVLTLTLDAADAIQYTTATAGVLDDDSTDQTPIHGIRLVDTTGEDTAVATMFLTYPHTKV